ncbi:hypothetical protein ACIBCA_30265 [Kitasatospora sp. NPDC051170]|uniref:hypothetical protein n=1 Tax=Kitasatospora sp. NPDC051170 TaxID=3364056 RepID=UPI00378D47AF
MVYLWGEAIRWVDDEPQPGVVEVRFTDVDGRWWSIVDKTAMFGADQALGRGVWIEPDSPFPFPVTIDCTVLNTTGTAEDEIATISTALPWALETPCGRHEFRVRRHQLCED